MKDLSCEDNSANLINMLRTCDAAAAGRWANFVAVNYYKRSEGGGSFQAVDLLNGKLLCGLDPLQEPALSNSSDSHPERISILFF
ncbi:PLC-LIKE PHOSPHODIESTERASES SUPERFAMILY PROTEIN [Salix koriyanagi]|uniref:PLC-LIKE PHOSPHODIESTERASES SUPERFAMILY PROTEIN n=1 Tax=Salix koriyanagi TaxID=2511006 RepID=A0A9Q0UD87_9ROSI|nr:PLC-LIKE PHOSPHODIESTERASES SUPERFAMILY PROTEIN [Salix koriyanagi]